MAALTAAVRVILVDGAPLSATVLHLSVPQQLSTDVYATPMMVALAVMLHEVLSVQPSVLKPMEVEIDGKPEEKWSCYKEDSDCVRLLKHIFKIQVLHLTTFTCAATC